MQINSVWGDVSSSAESVKGTLWQTWVGTASGTELLAVAHSGGPLLLDEIGALPQGVSLNVYALLHGKMKARMNEFGGMRAQFTWRLLILSTGELSVAARIAQEGGGRKAMGGELVRMIDIPLAELPDFEAGPTAESAALVERLKAMLGEVHGVAGRRFVAGIMTEFPTYKALRDALRADLVTLHDSLIATLEAVRPLLAPHRRALRHFALVWLMGRWAYEVGASPFAPDVVKRAVVNMATAWLKGFPSDSDRDRLLDALRTYLRAQQNEIVDVAHEAQEPWLQSGLRPKVLYYDGKLWFSPQAFEYACAPMAFKRAGKELDNMGILHRHEGDHQHKTKLSIWPKVFGAARYYALHAARFLTPQDIDGLLEHSRGLAPELQNQEGFDDCGEVLEEI